MIGYMALFFFCFAYLLVMTEELTGMRKSKPMILAAGLIWAMIGWFYTQQGLSEVAEQAVRKNLLEYAELMLFILVVMIYLNSMQERGVFDKLHVWLTARRFTYRQIFWMTGGLTFIISPIADNLTTALLMCAVILAVAENNSRFIAIACTNVVVAANSGGVYSPFGDITSLMVWQSGMLSFTDFFTLFLPSLVTFLVPAVIMHFSIEKALPGAAHSIIIMKRGARRIVILFFMTLLSAFVFHQLLAIPAVIGMLTGLAYLQFFGYYLKQTQRKCLLHEQSLSHRSKVQLGDVMPFDVFAPVARAEWDTLFFFYGVVLCVGGLGFLGYSALASEQLYQQHSATYANISIGLLSAVVDNIPVMFSVLTMQPDMSVEQWLLVTLAAGTGGSLLSIGSAAGVALMGHARGHYTFLGHLRWTPAIAVGYFAGIVTHLWLSGELLVN